MAHDIIFTTHSQVQTNDINNKEIIEIDDNAQTPDQKSRFRPGILESVICITYVYWQSIIVTIIIIIIIMIVIANNNCI